MKRNGIRGELKGNEPIPIVPHGIDQCLWLGGVSPRHAFMLITTQLCDEAVRRGWRDPREVEPLETDGVSKPKDRPNVRRILDIDEERAQSAARFVLASILAEVTFKRRANE